jgi:POT family proton-dependent oligopeptide transporter
MFVLLILCAFSMLFWAFFELAGSAINLFTDRHVDRVVNIFSWQVTPTASFLTTVINPAFVIALAIPFAKLWVWLAKHNTEPSSPLKFAFGLLQLGAGFAALWFGALQAGTDGRCSMVWLVLGFLLHTTGELCLSPVGLSTVTKLSPARYVGMFMGVWFLASSLGNIFGGWVGGLTQDHGFATVFKGVAIAVGVASVLLFVLTPIVKRMMHGVK